MSNEFICWKCQESLIHVILPMSRREECDNCQADQHVCNMCLYYEAGRCNEERAEHISDTERANFCDYFKPSNAACNTLNKQKSQDVCTSYRHSTSLQSVTNRSGSLGASAWKVSTVPLGCR